jgi:hypothetical protein
VLCLQENELVAKHGGDLGVWRMPSGSAQQYTEEMKRMEEEMKERLKKCLEPDCQVLTGWRRCAIHDHQWREQKRKERWAPRRREPADES